MNEKIKFIANEFQFDGELQEIKENSQGNINSTYILTYKNDEAINKYLLQKINSSVFVKPYLVMKNIDLITNHISKKLNESEDQEHKTLNIIRTNKGDITFDHINQYSEKEYYRAYEYLDGCVSYDTLTESNDPNLTAYNAGKCFGLFHQLLSDFNANNLSITIEDFHNTPKRFRDLISSIENNPITRSLECSHEIINLIARAKECSVIWEELQKTIPLRVTHNDTKLNNILFNKDTNEAVAVIDLDTVMPGTYLFDIGDGIRSTCSNSFEDETDKEKIYINLELVKAYLSGYLEQMAPFLTKDEIKYIGLSIKVLTYELTLRFLTDYINGDTYFKIKYNKHNRDRFLNQYHLLLDIENKMDDINDFVSKTYKKTMNRK